MSDLLATNVCGIALRNPVILAAGTCGTLDEFGDVLDLSRIGGLVSKSITREAREGNPTWRVVEARHGAGMLNAIGLANPGIEKFEEVYLPRAERMSCAVIGSVAGYSVEDYLVVAACMDEWGKRRHGGAEARSHEGEGGGGVGERGGEQGVSDTSRKTHGRDAHVTGVLDAIELNVSCPNVKAGCEFVSSPAALREVVSDVRKVVTRCALIVKLSPLVTDIAQVAKAAVDAGADALTISNTIPAMAIDVRTRSPRLANKTGGLSGPGLHPVAVRLVYECWTKVCRDARGPGQHVPIIGAGGVLTWEDAAEFILAGASAVQIGTGLFADPRVPLKVARGLEKWVKAQKCGNVRELVGAVRV